MSTWDMIRLERASFADALASLPPDAWDAQSLAGRWSVRDVVAHMIATAQMTPPKFFGAMIGSGFSFQSMTAKKIAGVKAGPVGCGSGRDLSIPDRLTFGASWSGAVVAR